VSDNTTTAEEEFVAGSLLQESKLVDAISKVRNEIVDADLIETDCNCGVKYRKILRSQNRKENL